MELYQFIDVDCDFVITKIKNRINQYLTDT